MFYQQRVWISPTGRTAYGVTFIDLPFAFSEDFVLDAFLNDMRMREGEAASSSATTMQRSPACAQSPRAADIG